MTRGFYIGRFQPFHRGHDHVVREVAAEVDELVIGIGSAGKSHSRKNPFTGGERIVMVERALADLDCQTYVLPIEDIERNAVWVSHVQCICPPFDVTYSNNPLVIRLLEEAGHEVRQVPMHNRDVLEGTEIRSRMIHGGAWHELVPEPVAETVEQFDGVARLRQVTDSDGAEAGPDQHDP